VIPRLSVRSRTPASGFTLVEILVVMFIIGIIVTVVGLSGGGARERHALREEALRLQQLVSLAAEESVLGSQQIGIEFRSDGYQFMTLDGQRWRLIDDGGSLRPRGIESDITLTLSVEGQADDLSALGADDSDLRPQVLLLSSGEATPFSIELRNRSAGRYTLAVDSVGQTTLTDQSGDS
jgi:general secretion pathway protein H